MPWVTVHQKVGNSSKTKTGVPMATELNVRWSHIRTAVLVQKSVSVVCCMLFILKSKNQIIKILISMYFSIDGQFFCCCYFLFNCLSKRNIQVCRHLLDLPMPQLYLNVMLFHSHFFQDEQIQRRQPAPLPTEHFGHKILVKCLQLK